MSRKRLLPLILSLLAPILLSGQLGIRTYYSHTKADGWQTLAGLAERNQADVRYSPAAWGVGLDYWFRLENYRVEFLPEIGIKMHKALRADDLRLDWNSYYLRFNTQFYILNFEGDCDCPTFSKHEPWFQKGFFLSASLGAALSRYDTDLAGATASQWNYSFAVGAGLDLGVSDVITITPYIQWQHWFTPEWEGLQQLLNVESQSPGNSERTRLSDLQPGIRLGIRF